MTTWRQSSKNGLSKKFPIVQAVSVSLYYETCFFSYLRFWYKEKIVYNVFVLCFFLFAQSDATRKRYFHDHIWSQFGLECI